METRISRAGDGSATGAGTAETPNRDTMPERRFGRAYLSVGSALIALPLALVMTIWLVVKSGLSVFWAIPVYGLLGAGLTVVFVLCSYVLGRSSDKNPDR